MNVRFAAGLILSGTMIGCGGSPASPGEIPTTTAAAHGGKTHWSYRGGDGPDAWGDLAPEFALCKTGKRQTPIALSTKEAPADKKLPPLVFEYPKAVLTLKDNGHGFNATSRETADVITPNGRYELVQFHFHAPSEHTLDGRAFDAEMHLVHKNAEGQLAVVGIFFLLGPTENTALKAVFDHAPTEAENETSSGVPVDLAPLLGDHVPYFTYSGSLTTPPCSEGITWFVTTTPAAISRPQLDRLKTVLHTATNRPIQPLGGRTISRFSAR